VPVGTGGSLLLRKGTQLQLQLSRIGPCRRMAQWIRWRRLVWVLPMLVGLKAIRRLA